MAHSIAVAEVTYSNSLNVSERAGWSSSGAPSAGNAGRSHGEELAGDAARGRGIDAGPQEVSAGHGGLGSVRRARTPLEQGRQMAYTDEFGTPQEVRTYTALRHIPQNHCAL